MSTTKSESLSFTARSKLEAFRRVLRAERALDNARRDLDTIIIPPSDLDEYYRLTEEMRTRYDA